MEYPSVKILSQDFELLDEIDSYTSLRFKRSWQSYGDFELHVVGYNDNLKKLNYIMLDNNPDKAGIIKSVNIVSDKNGLNTVVKGCHLNGIMTQRIVLPYDDSANHGYFCVPKQVAGQTSESVSVETIIKTFIRSCFPYNTLDPRSIGLYMPESQSRGTYTVWLSRYEQLDEVLQKICEYADIGYRVYIDLENRRLTCDISEGVDRSSEQSINSRVIISPDFESANSLEWVSDTTKEKNVAYAGGAGEDENRTVLALTNEQDIPAGLQRSEVFTDCGTLEAAETNEAISLAEEGRHKLLDYRYEESMTAENNLSGSFIYGRDFDLGDLVTVSDRSINKSEDKRITEAEEYYEAKSVGVRLTFGTSAEHLNRVIKTFLPTVK